MNRLKPSSRQSKHVDRLNHDEDASGYDDDITNHKDPIRAGYKELLDWVASSAMATEETRVLELGSGTGNLSTLLPSCRHLTCVDISSEMTTLGVCATGIGYQVQTIEPQTKSAWRG